MIYAGIDIAKNKHDCFITNSDGKVLFPVFIIRNNQNGYDDPFSRIQSFSPNMSKLKVGIETTEHYSCNLFSYLFDKGLSHMKKQELCYLRFALINIIKYICHWDKTFGTYL